MSKFKTEEDIIEAYQAGQRHFGENYVKELNQKAKSTKLLHECAEIKWHFIGNLQSSKCKQIASLPNLFMVETIDSAEIACKLNKAWGKRNSSPLNIMIQVNTSNEPQKNGVEPELVTETYEQILNNCENLKISGLMTIGSLADSLNTEKTNKDFQTLIECREKIAEQLKIQPIKIELSMGMSNDFEKAIMMGSTNVRVGSLIFGEREKK